MEGRLDSQGALLEEGDRSQAERQDWQALDRQGWNLDTHHRVDMDLALGVHCWDSTCSDVCSSLRRKKKGKKLMPEAGKGFSIARAPPSRPLPYISSPT